MKIDRLMNLALAPVLLMQVSVIQAGGPASPRLLDHRTQDLYWAANNGEIAAVQASISAGANVNAVNDSCAKWTALHIAAKKGYADIVRILLEVKADVHAINCVARTALHMAAEGGHVSVTRLLLDAGANPRAVDAGKQTALHMAAESGHVSVTRLLLDAGANPCAVKVGKVTALHMAADRGHAEVVQALLQAGADTKAFDCCGKTALDRAIREGHESTAQTLRKALLPKQYENTRLPSNWFLSAPAAAKSLVTASGKRHYPIIFLIDQKNAGGIGLKKQDGAHSTVSIRSHDSFFHTLLMQVALNNKLIIASKRLAYGLIALSHERQDYAAVRHAIKERWDIYSVPETQFTVWLPRNDSNDCATIFKLSSFEKLSTRTRSEILRYCPSDCVGNDDIRVKDIQRTYHEQDLEKIFDLDQFARDKNTICDVWLGGHGASAVRVAGLPVGQEIPEEQRINSLLSFLNEKLNSNVVCINSCYAGGLNATLMRTQRDGSLIDNKYPLVICSVTDRMTISDASKVVPLSNTFFDFALGWTEQGHIALEKFTKTIVPELKRPNGEKDLRGYAAFPRVWLPGNVEYHARGATSDVYHVTSEQARTIELRDRQMVLWYPKIVNAPVTVTPARINVHASNLSRYRFGKALSTTEECTEHNLSQSEINHIQAKCPTLSLLLQAHGKDRLQGWIDQAKKYLYPEFILMRDTAHQRLQLKKVEVEDGGNPLMGIFRFLRDSFKNADWESHERKDILIESLEGVNDLPFHIEMTTPQESLPLKPLYAKLCTTAGQRITLENVLVRIYFRGSPRLEFHVSLDNQRWVHQVQLQPTAPRREAWSFKPTSASPLEEFEKIANQANILDNAIENGNAYVVRQLLETGISINILNTARPHKDRPLHAATRNGYASIAQLLLSAGADAHAADWMGRTALHWAVQKGRTSIAQLLLSAGADAHAADWMGRTALHWAVQKGRTSIAQLLLDAGANINALDNDNRTALSLAVFIENKKIVRLLAERGAYPVQSMPQELRAIFDEASHRRHRAIKDALSNIVIRFDRDSIAMSRDLKKYITLFIDEPIQG